MSSAPLYRYDFGVVPPLQMVESGETVTVAFPDSDALGPDLQPMDAHLFDGGRIDRGNPVYGPIAVSGAEPGDALQVDLLAVRPNRRTARTLLAPCHGLFPAELPGLGPVPEHLYLWDVGEREATLANPLGGVKVAIPVRPFPGCLGVAVPEQPAPTTMVAGSMQGGNLDHPDLVAGTTLWLPVRVPGALFYIGDMHAAQGHGECTGGALEVSGEVTVRLSLCKGAGFTLPRYRTEEGIGCLAVGADFREGARVAIAGMASWLAEGEGLWKREQEPGGDPSGVFDLAVLVTQCCELRTGGMTGPYAVVSCFIPDAAIPSGPAIAAIPPCD